MGGSRGGGGGGEIGLLRNTGTDQPREAIGSLGRRPIRPSVKYVDDLKKDPLAEFFGSAHET